MAQTVAVERCVMKGRKSAGEERLKSDGRSLSSSHPDGFQLLRSSSVAVSTSQDLDDNAAITAFCTQGETAHLRHHNPQNSFCKWDKNLDDGI